jgi:glycosyltransferase involved in cell wall biosynthesis
VRIALYLPNLDGGGAERMMVNLAQGFAERGVRVDLVLAAARGPYLASVGRDVNVVNLASSGVSSSLPKLARYLRAERPEALLATLRHANVVAVWAKKLARVPTRVILRHSNMLFPTPPSSYREKALYASVRNFYPWAEGHIAVSQGVAADVQRSAGVAPDKICTIHNPVVTPELLLQAQTCPDHPFFTAGVPAEGSPPVILGVGRLTSQKDFHILLRAFAAVYKVRPARLIILGEGERRRQLEALAEELGVSAAVSLPGFVDNPFAYMAHANLYVLSSKWEGLPGALIQALACGCPVVSTDCPSGPREILENGKFGTLVAVGDVEGLAAAISKALDAPPDKDGLKERAAAFSTEAVIPRYLKVLLAKGR